jgi:prolyl-tRNA synthetase
VNEVKLRNGLGETFRPAHEDEIAQQVGPPGFIGPVGAGVRIVMDAGVAPGGYVTGANRPDHHLRGVEPGRDFEFDRLDVRTVEDGDTVGGQPIRIEPAIEVGNIFKLGTRYSEPLGATYLDESGREQLVVMGSYGIGPARIAAAAIEQFADERGISWPRAIAPWDVELVALGKPGTPERDAAEIVYAQLREAGLDVLYDDRDAGPGEKFADAELLGVPLRLTLGKRSLESGALEAQVRRGRADQDGGIPLADPAEAVQALWQTLP